MNDKTKKPQVTKEDVSATIIACGSTSDPGSRRVSAAIIADNVNDGRKGAEITAGARVSENVGACVASFYEGKTSTVGEKASGWLTSTMNAVSGVRAAIAGAVIEAVKDNAPVAADYATAGAVSVIRANPQVQEVRLVAASNGPPIR